MSILAAQFLDFNTKASFARDYYGYVYQKVLSGPNKMPGEELSAGSPQAISIDQMLSVLDQGPLEVFCCWRSPEGFRFGVRLHANFQMFGLGYRPNWYYMADQGAVPGSVPNWISSGDDPSIPHTWANAPFKIVATPDSQHTSLSLSVNIN